MGLIETIERLSNLLYIYKIIIISFSAVILGATIIYLVSPLENLISILKEDVLKEIGIAFIIIGLAILFYEAFLRKSMINIVGQFLENNLIKLINDQCELLKSISRSVIKSGLVNVYAPGEGGSEILNSAKGSIKLLGITINKYFTPDGGQDHHALRDFAKKGKLQILMLNPNSPQVVYREKDENNDDLKGQIEMSLNAKRRFCDEIPEEYRSNVELKLYDSYPLYAMTIIDDNRFRITPYLYNKKGQECPTYEYLKIDGGSYKEYSDHFNDLWKSGIAIKCTQKQKGQ